MKCERVNEGKAFIGLCLVKSEKNCQVENSAKISMIQLEEKEQTAHKIEE